MKASSVVQYFGGSQSQAARALGISRAAVNKWVRTEQLDPTAAIPEGAAYKVEVITGGALKVDPASYAPTEAA